MTDDTRKAALERLRYLRDDQCSWIGAAKEDGTFTDDEAKDLAALEYAIRALEAPSGPPVPTSAIPHNWLDPLLTGPKAVIGDPPYDCKDIERLLNAIRKRLSEPGHDDA